MAHRAKVVAAAQAKAAFGMSSTRWPQAYLCLLVVGGQSRFLEDGSMIPQLWAWGHCQFIMARTPDCSSVSGPVACGHI